MVTKKLARVIMFVFSRIKDIHTEVYDENNF